MPNLRLWGWDQLSRWFWCTKIWLPLNEYSSRVEIQWKYWTKCWKSLVKWKEPRDFGFPRNNLTSNIGVGENVCGCPKVTLFLMWSQLTTEWLHWGRVFRTIPHLPSIWHNHGHKESSDFLLSREEGFLSLFTHGPELCSWCLSVFFLEHKLAEKKKYCFFTPFRPLLT